MYVDKYGRYHHKPCIDGEPSSNNGWIYTAYAAKLGLPIDWAKLESCYNRCLIPVLIRSPGKELPPMSRDEILGMAALDLLKEKHLNGWNYSPRPIPRFNPFKLIAQLWELRPKLGITSMGNLGIEWKHRNYFWENNLDQLYRFAFSVPLTDRNFIQSKWGDFNPIYWAIAKVDSMIGGESGIRWLKYGKSLEAMQSEFPSDHPLRNK